MEAVTEIGNTDIMIYAGEERQTDRQTERQADR